MVLETRCVFVLSPAEPKQVRRTKAEEKANIACFLLRSATFPLSHGMHHQLVEVWREERRQPVNRESRW